MRGQLIAALPRFAALVSGSAALTDAEGVVVGHADERSGPSTLHVGKSVVGLTAGATVPETVVPPWAGAKTYHVLPLGECFLLLAPGGREPPDAERLRKVLEHALPLIARVAGGEAVLFDQDGRRLVSVDSTGKSNLEYEGQVSALARQSMELGKAVLGDSTYIVGAKAVRIPVTERFGIGFNNNDSVAQRQRLIDSIYELNTADTTFDDIVGESPEIARLKREGREAAESDDTLLLVGAKGTGKRTLAQAIHNAGPRRSKPFVTVNCDALDQDLLAGAIFGYADAVIRGVMRGRHPGAIVLAGGGTLYLMNIDRMDLQVQAKLQQALSSGKFFPVGDNEPIELGARVIVSTTHNLVPLVKVGRFDEELYTLLVRHGIVLPALSVMPEVIGDLVGVFLRQLNLQYGTRVEGVDDEALSILQAQPWPANAWELRTFIQTVLAGMDDSVIVKKHHLPMGLLGQMPAGSSTGSEEDSVYGMLIRDYEAQIIKQALLMNGGSRLKTAEQLGLSKSSLWRKMKKLYID
ncbi:MAG: sigma 54-interacting transcriptional regulator [Planctomycetaceae bacterium]|nr:sigma 54-interacting transcriptional regulator [Planctomycetaceae bacterium]